MNPAGTLTPGYPAQSRLGYCLKPGGLDGKLLYGLHLKAVRDQTMLWQVETA